MNSPSPIFARGWISIPVSAREKYDERARRERHVRGVQRVGDAVGQQRVQAGPAGDDPERRDALGRRVALAHGGDVEAQLAAASCPASALLVPQSGQSGRGARRRAVVSIVAEVDVEERVDERRLRAGQELQRLERLQRADHARDRPGDPRLRARQRADRRRRERAAVAGGALGHDRHHQAGPPHRAALDEVDAGVAAGLVDRVAGGEACRCSR